MLRPNLIKLSKSMLAHPTRKAFAPIQIVSNQKNTLLPIRFLSETPRTPFFRNYATKTEGGPTKHERYNLSKPVRELREQREQQKDDQPSPIPSDTPTPKSTRKPVWKKKRGVKDILFPETAETEEELLKVNAYCTAEYYDFDKLYAYLAKLSPRTTRTTSSYEVIYRPYGANEGAQVFYFEGGSMVAWGTTAKENQELLRELKQFEQNPVEEVQTETMNWAFTEKETTTLEKDTVLISKDLNERDQVAHKLAFSYGLHQSVKLEVHEKIAESLFQTMKDTPELLLQRDYSLFSMSRRRAVRKTHSALLRLRADINLYSELLEIPDIFWDEHHLEINYKKIAKHLVIESRTSIVNKKIDYSDHLNKALRQQLAEDYGVRLEWLIIILIAIEVVQGLYLIWTEWNEEEEPSHP